MKENNLTADEFRRESQHSSVKSQIETGVNSEIAARANKTTAVEEQKIENTADNFRGKAINEVIVTEREVGRSRFAARISQIIDFIFYVIYALLTIRLLLALLAARSNAGFVQFIRNITDPLYEPFRGITASPAIEGGYTFAVPIVIAIIVYILIHLGINGLLRLITTRKTEI